MVYEIIKVTKVKERRTWESILWYKHRKLAYSLHSAAKNITGHKKSWARSWESQIRQFLSGKMGVRLDKDTTPIPR